MNCLFLTSWQRSSALSKIFSRSMICRTTINCTGSLMIRLILISPKCHNRNTIDNSDTLEDHWTKKREIDLRKTKLNLLRDSRRLGARSRHYRKSAKIQIKGKMWTTIGRSISFWKMLSSTIRTNLRLPIQSRQTKSRS